jgi:hypothetical protein
MVSQATPKAPISQKVYGASGGGLALGLVTWALTTFIPAWHSGIPPTLQPLIPALVAVVGAFAGGWFSKHRLTPQELQDAITFAKSIESIIHPATNVVTLSQGHIVTPEPSVPFDPTPGEPLPLDVVASAPPEHRVSTGMYVDPNQLPQDLKDPATDAGQPVSLEPQA